MFSGKHFLCHAVHNRLILIIILGVAGILSGIIGSSDWVDDVMPFAGIFAIALVTVPLLTLSMVLTLGKCLGQYVEVSRYGVSIDRTGYGGVCKHILVETPEVTHYTITKGFIKIHGNFKCYLGKDQYNTSWENISSVSIRRCFDDMDLLNTLAKVRCD